MSTLGDIHSITSSLVLIGGFGINAFVTWQNGRQAKKGVEVQTKTLVETKKIIEESKIVIDNVASMTDGRLTTVMEKSGVLEEKITELKDTLSQERIASAKKAMPRNRPITPRTPKKSQ